MNQTRQPLIVATLKIWIQYLGVAVSAIPAGLVYYLALTSGVRESLALCGSLVIGLGLSYFVWTIIANYPLVRKDRPKGSSNQVPMYVVLDTMYLVSIPPGRMIIGKKEIESNRVAAEAFFARFVSG